MRLAKLTTNYPSYLDQFYASRPALRYSSYAVQKAELDHDAFGWADFWSHALRPLGYDVLEITANNDHLQRAWAREAELDFLDPVLPFATARAQVEKFRPDVLFFDDHLSFGHAWITELRQEVPSVRLVIGWCGSPFTDADVFKAYDIVLSCIPEFVDAFTRMGHQSIHMNHAFDQRILERIGEPKHPLIPLAFVGQVQRGELHHEQRAHLLSRLQKSVDISIFSPKAALPLSARARRVAQWISYELTSALKAVGIAQDTLHRIPALGRSAAWSRRPPAPWRSSWERTVRAPVFGLDMYRTLRNSQVALNHHIDASRSSASNMRLFEGTGVGTCLLTDAKSNLRELFEVDSELVAYDSIDECVEKAQWLLHHPDVCQGIGHAAQQRTLRDHRFSARAAQLDSAIFHWRLPSGRAV